MTAELQEYLEQEYVDFEKGYFQGEHFWRAPVYRLESTPFHAIFEEFSALFPDHPNEHETAFYLTRSASGQYSILLRCPHFEHCSSGDLPALAKFIDSASATLTSSGSGEVELLDGSGERLHIRFYSPRDHIVALLQARASRTAA